MSSSYESFEVVIIGSGIAGGALAVVLARAGKSVLVLERSRMYRDRVRGEGVQPWGVAEARRLGLHETLVDAGGIHHSRFVPYDETLEPPEAEATALALDKILPGVWSAPQSSAHREELRLASARYSAGLRIASAECGAWVL